MKSLFFIFSLVVLFSLCRSVVYINDLSGGDQTLSVFFDSAGVDGDTLRVGGAPDKTPSVFFDADLTLNLKNLNNNKVWEFVDLVTFGIRLQKATCATDCQVVVEHNNVILDTVGFNSASDGSVINFDVTSAFKSVAEAGSSTIVELKLRNNVACAVGGGGGGGPPCDKIKFFSASSGNPSQVLIKNRAILKSEDTATVRKDVLIEITGPGTVQKGLRVSYTEYGDCVNPDVVTSFDHYEPAWTRAATPTFDQVGSLAAEAGIKICIFWYELFWNRFYIRWYE